MAPADVERLAQDVLGVEHWADDVAWVIVVDRRGRHGEVDHGRAAYSHLQVAAYRADQARGLRYRRDLAGCAYAGGLASEPISGRWRCLREPDVALA